MLQIKALSTIGTMASQILRHFLTMFGRLDRKIPQIGGIFACAMADDMSRARKFRCPPGRE